MCRITSLAAAGCSATAAGSGWGAASRVPHSEQNISPGVLLAPQLGQMLLAGAASGAGEGSVE
jgi:hypothetical protein